MTDFSRDKREQAAQLVHQQMQPTPQYVWPQLCKHLNANVWVKHENHTATGAFKIRGGITFLNWLSQVHPSVKGIITAMAEIFQCKQKDGRSSFSNTPCPSQAVNGPSETHSLWRKMNKLVKEGAEISASMRPDYNSILTCNEKSGAFNLKVNKVTQGLKNCRPLPIKKCIWRWNRSESALAVELLQRHTVIKHLCI
jgi:hypothetical protein